MLRRRLDRGDAVNSIDEITVLNDNSDYEVECCWFDAQKHLHTAKFPFAALQINGVGK